MLDNSFQSRYDRIPVATYTSTVMPGPQGTPFILMHHHREFEVLLITQGACRLEINREPLEAEQGDIVLIPPYALHSGSILPGRMFSHQCFCFDLALAGDEELTQMLESGCWDTTKKITPGSTGYEVVLDAVQQVYRQSSEQQPGWDLIARGQMSSLLGRLVQSKRIFSGKPNSKDVEFCIRVLQYLESHYAQEITSRDVAQEFSYTQSYFCRLFQENFGMPFQKYLCLFRLARVRLLLCEPETAVIEAAEQVGFHNASYFSRMFREEFGCTPAAFQHKRKSKKMQSEKK